MQVACGQQHSICRAVPRDAPLLQDGEVGVGSDCGADAYVWGNGTLGQLGLGKWVDEWVRTYCLMVNEAPSFGRTIYLVAPVSLPFLSQHGYLPSIPHVVFRILC